MMQHDEILTNFNDFEIIKIKWYCGLYLLSPFRN